MAMLWVQPGKVGFGIIKAVRQRTVPVANHRIQLLTQIIRYLLTTIPEQRGQTLREEPALYQLSDDPFLNDLADFTDLDRLLQNIPFSE